MELLREYLILNVSLLLFSMVMRLMEGVISPPLGFAAIIVIIAINTLGLLRNKKKA